MSFILSIAVIVLFFMHFSLRDRIDRLEQPEKYKQRQTKVTPDKVVNVVEPSLVPPQQPTTNAPLRSEVTMAPPRADYQPPKPTPPPVIKPAEPSPITLWLKENTLIKVGALIFFLGAVWFVSYAISQGWITPLGRIMLGLSLGLVVLALGHWRRTTSLEQYLTLTTLGSGIIIASVYVGQNLFNLFNPLVALLLLLITIIYTVVVSLITNKEWLCVASVISAFVAPLMVNAPDSLPIPFFFYLTIITTGFLTVLLRRSWRVITLTLISGTGIYEILYFAEGEISNHILWLFVLIFSGLFYGASLISMVRDREPRAIDVTALGMTAVLFVGWTNQLIQLDGLVTFAAALLAAGTGYVLMLRSLSSKVVAVYSALAGLLILLATSFTFSGFILTVAYTFEIGVAIALAGYLKFGERITTGLCVLFVIPVMTAIINFNYKDWHTGILHDTGYSLYVLVLVSFLLSAWLIKLYRQYKDEYFHVLAASFAGLTYLLFLTTTIFFWPSAMLGIEAVDATLADTLATILTYLSWLIVSVSLLISSFGLQLTKTWTYAGLLSLALPLTMSLKSFTDEAWADSVNHLHATASYLVVSVLGAMLLWFATQYIRNKKSVALSGTVTFLVLFWGFTTILAWQFWHGLVEVETIAVVMTYVTWASVTYLLSYFVYQIKLPNEWWALTNWTLSLPVVLSLSSFTYTDWTNGWLDPQAVGLYTLTTILFVMGITYNREYRLLGDQFAYLKNTVQAFFVGAGIYAISLVWLVTHAEINQTDTAVMVSLFIYTIVGLVFYLLSKQTDRKDFKLVSAIILSGVVARLALVEVWDMEVFWRIITFMGIGALFILTALVEKPFQKKDESELTFIPKQPPQQ